MATSRTRSLSRGGLSGDAFLLRMKVKFARDARGHSTHANDFRLRSSRLA